MTFVMTDSVCYHLRKVFGFFLPKYLKTFATIIFFVFKWIDVKLEFVFFIQLFNVQYLYVHKYKEIKIFL